MADFDDFDDFDFKPITKGLGFHHGDKKETKNFNRTGALEKNSERRRTSSEVKIPESSNSISKNDLSSFYQTNEIHAPVSELSVSALSKASVDTPQLFSAPIYLRFFAWICDFAIVSSLLAITLTGFFVLLGKDLSQIKTMLTISEFAFFGGVFFTVFYIAYFSVLDLNGSMGKTLFGLTVKSEAGTVTLNQTLIRSIITLVSFVLLFFPVLIDLQGKATHTLVVRK